MRCTNLLIYLLNFFLKLVYTKWQTQALANSQTHEQVATQASLQEWRQRSGNCPPAHLCPITWHRPEVGARDVESAANKATMASPIPARSTWVGGVSTVLLSAYPRHTYSKSYSTSVIQFSFFLFFHHSAVNRYRDCHGTPSHLTCRQIGCFFNIDLLSFYPAGLTLSVQCYISHVVLSTQPSFV